MTTDYEPWRKAVSYGVATVCTIVSLVATVFVFVVIRTRKFTFNIYLVFIILPDALLSGVYGISCFYEAAREGIMPPGLCYLRSFLLLFYYHSNLYMNAVVAKQIYTLVVNSYRRQRTKPPTARTVVLQSLGVYLGSGLLAGWYVLPVSWSPVVVSTNPYCTSYFGSQAFGFWGGMAVAVVCSTPPFLYVFGIAFRVWHRNLLPLRGRTRALALFFFRIVAVFVVFYTPMLVLAFVKTTIPPEHHGSTALFVLLQVNTILNPIQNVFTLYCLLQKDDIAQALRESTARFSVVSFFRQRTSSTRSNHEAGEWDVDDTYGDSHRSQTARETATERESAQSSAPV